MTNKTPKEKEISVALNVMLLRNSTFEEWKDAISNYNESNVLKKGDDYVLYRKKGIKDYPDWLKSFQAKILGEDISGNFSKSSSDGLTLIKKVIKDEKEYLFALNFGQGRYNIKKSKICDDFGILIAQKFLLDKNAKVKNTQSRNIGGSPVNKKRTFANDLEENELFSLLDEAEITRELGIISDGTTEFSSIIGKYGPLNIKLKFKESDIPCFEKLTSTLNNMIDIYESAKDEDLSQFFKGVQIVDTETSERLFNTISTMIQAENNRFFLFEPECDYDLTAVNGFKYEIDGRKSEIFEKLNLSDYLSLRHNPTIDDLRNDNIVLINDSGHVAKKWSVLDTLYGEYVEENEAYILSTSKWNKIVKDKYERITQEIEDIEEIYNVPQSVKDSTVEKILEFKASEEYKEMKNKKVFKEDCFNRALSEEDGYVLFDKKCITIDKSPLEVCDVLKKEPLEFIHVKIGTSADKLSHLFSQGYASARYYAIDASTFTKLAEEKIGVKDFHLPEDIREQEITINYMILNKGTNQLSFLNKMSLIERIEDLKAFGFNVKLSWVNGVNLNPKESA